MSHHPLPFFEELEGYLKKLKSKGGFRISGWPLAILGLCLLVVSFIFMPSVVRFALSLSLFLAPVWLPVLIVGGAWTAWVILKRSEYIAKQNVILLEIKPPRSHAKTPLAMEAVLSGLHHGPGEGTWYKQYILGQVRPWWSLEIVSLEGQVHFYIWTRAGFRRIIESQIYAQYPGAQVVEAVDYTRTISALPGEWTMWGCDFKKSREDPYPIKTYVEYGLDKAQKEFEQIDPLSNLVEYMGSMGKGEYLWIQIIVRIHKGEKFQAGVEFKKEFKHMKDWKEFGKAIVEDIRKSTREPYTDPATGEERPGFPNPTKGQMEAMAAIERNTSKLAF
ncbi:MAG TPA: hypothetical protein VMT80_02345, partial [Candidatus Paceibacterota bacterium]|nr:hypothetical protein [Candidatus Paceibacterota bacterium]